jgi:hypothetical protein
MRFAAWRGHARRSRDRSLGASDKFLAWRPQSRRKAFPIVEFRPNAIDGLLNCEFDHALIGGVRGWSFSRLHRRVHCRLFFLGSRIELLGLIEHGAYICHRATIGKRTRLGAGHNRALCVVLRNRLADRRKDFLDRRILSWPATGHGSPNPDFQRESCMIRLVEN